MTSRDAEPVIIGLDVGTSLVKSVAFRPGKGAVAEGSSPVAVHADGVRHEVSVADITVAVDTSLGMCVRRLAGAQVLAVGLTTAMHGLVGLAADDRPASRLLTWADARAQDSVSQLRDVDWHNLTGTPLHPMSPFVKLHWLATHEPDLFRGARRWVGIKEIVVDHLCGEWLVDESSASGTGLVARGGRDWCAEALAVAGLDRGALAPVVAASTPLRSGEHANLVGLRSGTPIVIGAGDGPTANVGVGATEAGVAALSLGTSAAVRVTVDGPVEPGASRFVYALDGDRWVTGGAISNAGSAVEWVARTLGCSGAAELVDLACQAPAGSDGLAILPWLLAERAPRWDATLEGAVVGLSARHTPAHIARATLEGIARHIAAVADSLDEVGGITTVRATGGGFSSDLWAAMIAAAFDRPLEVLAGIEGGSLGAASFAATALGVADDTTSARTWLMGGDPATRLVEVDERLHDAAQVTRSLLAEHLNR